jgi:Na+/H+ antiporter NhaD/arsenite permease-like protein
MSSLEPQRGSRPSRRQREQRGFQLVVVGGGAGVVTVVGFALAIFGVIGYGLPFVALVVAVICLFLFRRLVGPSR